jgi:hypothetical protein
VIRLLVIAPIAYLLLASAGASAQSRGEAAIAWDGLGANPNARHLHHRRSTASHSHQEPDVTGSLPPRPDWFPVLSADEVEQEKRLLNALHICRGCEASDPTDAAGSIR